MQSIIRVRNKAINLLSSLIVDEIDLTRIVLAKGNKLQRSLGKFLLPGYLTPVMLQAPDLSRLKISVHIHTLKLR